MVIVLRMGVAEGGFVSAPPLLALNRDAAASRAEASGLKPIFYGPSGYGVVVASQSVRAGQQVARGTYIQLQMRPGAAVARMRVPDFANLPVDAARALAQQSRLRPIFAGDQAPGGHVVGQSPAAGAEADPYATIDLRVGAVQTRVPTFLGRSRASAQAVAAKAGLTLDIKGDAGDLARVAQQSPRPRSSVAPGGLVAVVMATPPAGDATAGAVAVPPVAALATAVAGQQPATSDRGTVEQVPDVTHDTRFEALPKLESQGFKAAILGDTADDARVSDQNPAGGAMARRGSKVSITLAKPSAGGGMGKWIAIVGGLAGVGAIIAVVARRRPDRHPDPGPDPVVVSPDPHPKTDKPLPLVTYSAGVDPGRPTVRFAHEPRAAARALALPRGEGSTS